MSKRIGVVAPSSRMAPETAAEVQALVGALYPDGSVEVVFHPQCFLADGHFAGSDEARAAAFIEVANDPSFHALWFGRGGYGSCRIATAVLPCLTEAAAAKEYLGYSDAGALLAGLYNKGFKRLAHGPMAQDIRRAGGEAAAARALAWLATGDRAGLESGVSGEQPTAAFNLMILSSILGTPLQPDLTNHILMIEEVDEYLYRIDRALFHVTSHEAVRRVAGIRLGRVTQTPSNDPDFGRAEEEIVADWCARSGIAYLGRADIGHDADNKIVPFGLRSE